jgi:hypothetical protein
MMNTAAATPIIDETNELVKLELEPLIAAGEVPIMGGFIAASRAVRRRRLDAADRIILQPSLPRLFMQACCRSGPM